MPVKRLLCILSIVMPAGIADIGHPPPARAHFSRVYTSARSIALGGAFAGIADDPSAVSVNPGGLTSVNGYSFLATIIKPYGIEDLEESYFAAVIPAGIGTAGISWHRVSLDGIASEDKLSVGFGKDYIRTSQDASLSFGGTLDLARVSYSDRYEGSQTVVTGSLGMLLRPFPIIGMGYCIRNLIPQSFDFLDGGGVTDLERTHVWSLAYHWDNRVSVVFDRSRDQRRKWNNQIGIEVAALPNLTLRSGANEQGVSGGLGIHLSGIRIDLGVSSHDVMGMSYVATAGYTFLPRAGGENETD